MGKGWPVTDPVKRPTILVVDDNADLLGLIADSLRKLGPFTVVTASDGSEGLERYFAVHPDCVIIDVKMPGLDGYQLMKALRGDPDSRSTPLVILSAMAQPKDQLAGLLSGADEYVLKPIGPQGLVNVISTVIGRSEAERCRRQRALLDELSRQDGGDES
jgi:two-component system alkaline phosphatase synthesis response regulator PhoP